MKVLGIKRLNNPVLLIVKYLSNLPRCRRKCLIKNLFAWVVSWHTFQVVQLAGMIMSRALIVAQREREVTNVRPFDSPEALSRPQAPLAAKSFYFLKSSPFPDFEAFVFLHLQICRMFGEIKSYRFPSRDALNSK